MSNLLKFSVFSFLIIAMIVVVTPLSNAHATDTDKAQKFVETMGNNAISFLADTSLNTTQKKQKFKKLLNNDFDMDKIGRFALGRNWKTISDSDKKEYLKLFNNMIVDVYSSRFSDYKGEAFTVDSARAAGSTDALVTSYIVPKNGNKVKVDWRVREEGKNFKVIDVLVEGVSMSLTQRSEFASIIQRGGGNIDVLLEHLRK